MAKSTPPIVNFNAGELSPLVDARSDIGKYANGCRTLENFIPLEEGGIIRTPGTYFIKEVKDSTKKSRLFPFQFSTTQSYQLEFGDLYIRFYKNQGRIVIDTSMDDFDPVDPYFVGEYTKIGHTGTLDFGGGKKLYIAAPYGLSTASNIKVLCLTNTVDTLSVTNPDGYLILIRMANGTSSKNSADLIQTAIRALVTVGGVSVVNLTVTENSAYSAARPIIGIHSDICSGGTASADTNDGANLPANAFDNNTGTQWASSISALPHWLQYLLAIAKTGLSYRITGYDNPAYMFTDFTLIGSNDGIGWTVLDTRSGLTWGANEIKTFYITTPGSYLYYRINGTSGGVGGQTIIVEAEVFDTVVSLSGGDRIYQCLIIVTGNATNTSKSPPFEASDWVLKILGDPVEIITPYLETELFQMKRKPQSGDILYLFHSNHPPAKLVRHSHINWEYVSFSIIITNEDSKPISAITMASPAGVYAGAHGWITGTKIVISGCNGMEELNGLVCTITYVDANSFTLDGIDSTDFTTYINSGRARVVVSGMNVADDYPSCGTFFEQRLTVAGTKNFPTRINLSTSGDYENFIQDPNEIDSAIQYDLVSAKIDNIRWLAAEDYLLAGTIGGIWKIGATNQSDPMSQVNILARKNIFVGASDVEPEEVIDSLLFLSMGGMSIRQIVWSMGSEKYVAPDMTRLASHIAVGATELTSGIVEMAFQSKPIPILWCLRADGVLLGMTYKIEEQVYAWFRWITDGLVESVSVESADEREDTVSIMVNRTIGGVPKRYIEYIKPVNFYQDIKEAFFVHSGLSTTLVTATQISGLLHLAGEEVDVMIEGIYIGRKTVSGGGVVTLGGTYTGKAHVGLPFTSKVEPMKLNAGSNLGTARGKKQKINKVTVILHETCKGEIGPNATKLRPIKSTAVDGVLVTDDYDTEFPGNWSDEATLCIVQDKPYPMTVLGLIPHLSLNEP